MAFGMDVLNDANHLQISSRRPQLVMAVKSSVTALNNAGPPQQYEAVVSYADISYTGVADSQPLLALQPDYATSLMTIFRSSNTWFYRIISETPPGSPIGYFIFDKAPSTPASSGMGFQLYDATGAPTINHTQKPLRPARLDSRSFTTSGSTFVGASAHAYAAVFSQYIGGWYYEQGGSPPPGQDPDPDNPRYVQKGRSVSVQMANSLKDMLYGEIVHAPADGVVGSLTYNPAIIAYDGQVLIVDVSHY